MAEVWDVPNTPIGWTAQGVDQSDMVLCEVRTCKEPLRQEQVLNHMRLTHGMVPVDDDEVTQENQGLLFLQRAKLP